MSIVTKRTRVRLSGEKSRSGPDAERHGMYRTSEYAAWVNMLRRCTTGTKTYAHMSARYGDRGITVCAAWRESFISFYEHIGPKPTPQHTLDRVDNDRGYEPGNVRWATRAEQARNRSSTKMLTLDGDTQPIIVWAERFGHHRSLIGSRLKAGWDVERAITTPSRRGDL